MKLYEPSKVKEIKKLFGFRFAKSLGQNFLVDGDVVRGIVEGSGAGKNDLVIEIGPGIGTLTEALSEKAGRIIAIEIDHGLCEIMKFTLRDLNNVTIIEDDILKIDINELIVQARGDAERVMIVGNLPYYITTPILTRLLENSRDVTSMTVMMQKEVADRIAAKPGGRTYGAITLAVRQRADVVKIEEVPKESFMPQPKVDSEVVRLDIRETPAVAPINEKHYFSVIKTAFSKRRKTIINALAGDFPKDVLVDVLMNAGISEQVRPETLGPTEFMAISDGLVERGY